MRLLVTTALAVALVAFGPARAEDPPEGSIGVRIKAGDVIVKVDDYKVKDNVEQDDLQDTVKEIVKHKPGTKIKLGIKRDGKDMTVEVTVGKRSEIFPPKDKD